MENIIDRAEALANRAVSLFKEANYLIGEASEVCDGLVSLIKEIHLSIKLGDPNFNDLIFLSERLIKIADCCGGLLQCLSTFKEEKQ